MNWYIDVLKKYAVFSGRARRKEFWMFYLFYLIIVVVLGIVEWMIGIPAILTGIYTLALIVPTIAVTVRRLHDTGRSGWWWFIWLLPVIGGIVLLVFLVLDSQPGDNEYGANPKAAAA